jgi:hypothetical protein
MKSELKFLYFIFFAYILFQFLFIFITGYNGLYGQDGHEYYRYSKSLHQFLIQGTHPGSYFWTALYPLAGAILGFLTGPLLALQLISVLGSAWIMVLLVSYLQNEFPGREKEVALYACLFMGMSPYFFRYSVSIMSDIPALALIITAWYFADRYNKLKIIHHLYIAAICISAGVCTRVAFLPITIPVFVFIGLHIIRNFNLSHLIIVSLLIVIPFAITGYFKAEESVNIFDHYYVSSWSIFNFFRNEFVILDGNVSYLLPNLLYVVLTFIHPGYVLTGAIFIFYLFYNKRQPSFLFFSLVFAIVGYALFIAGIPYQNNRYMIGVVPFFLVICFPSFLSILSWFHYRKKLFNLTLFMVFSIQAMLLYRAILPFLKLNKLEQAISAKVISINSPVVYTLGMDGALSSYGYNGTIINLYGHLYTDIADSSLLLINKSGFESQWKGKSPMLNYIFIQKHSISKLITTFNDGWEVYEVRKKHSNTHSGIPGK